MRRQADLNQGLRYRRRALSTHLVFTRSLPTNRYVVGISWPAATVSEDVNARAGLLIAASLLLAGHCPVPGRVVRFEPTPLPVVRAMLELAEVGPDDVVFDLGSGDGRIPIIAAQEFGARGVGIEIDATLVARAQARARDASVDRRVEFRLGDMYAADLHGASVVTLFLHPGPNLGLRPKLLAELRPGSRVVSYIWDMGHWAPERVRSVGRRRTFLWRIPNAAAVSPNSSGRDTVIGCVAIVCEPVPAGDGLRLRTDGD